MRDAGSFSISGIRPRFRVGCTLLLVAHAVSRRPFISRRNCSKWFQLGTVGATTHRIASLRPTRRVRTRLAALGGGGHFHVVETGNSFAAKGVKTTDPRGAQTSSAGSDPGPVDAPKKLLTALTTPPSVTMPQLKTGSFP